MKLKFLLLLISTLIANLPVYSILRKEEAKFNPSPQKAKDKPHLKSKEKSKKESEIKSECCGIQQGRSDDGEVEIISICQQKDSTIVNIKALIHGNFCTTAYSISMNDDKGNTYQTIAIHGIPDCPEKQKVETGYMFSFEFEKIEKRIIGISLEEDINKLPPVHPYGVGWKWNDLNVSHCKF